MSDFNTKMRQAQINARRRAEQLVQNQRRKAKRPPAPLPASESLRSDGLSPQMAAALQAASKRLETDPRAKAIVDRAEVTRKVEALRKKLHIGNIAPAPETEFGRPLTPAEEAPSAADRIKAQRAEGILPPQKTKKSK